MKVSEARYMCVAPLKWRAAPANVGRLGLDLRKESAAAVRVLSHHGKRRIAGTGGLRPTREYTSLGVLHHPHHWLDLYERCGRAPEVGAASIVVFARNEIEVQLGKVPPAGLTLKPAFLRRVAGRKIAGGRNEKWRSYFTLTQTANLEAFADLALPGTA